MKKLWVYLLVILVTADNTELCQLFKLPILFQHYAEHKERDSSVSLIDFLSMHYWGDDLNDNDNDRDMQLPFKKLDAHPLQVFFLPISRYYSIKTHEQPIKSNYPHYQPGYYPNPSLSSPFRPPCA